MQTMDLIFLSLKNSHPIFHLEKLGIGCILRLN